ncbi:uncharacterized protein LOC131037537 [Cryptomeria japonica]|uniref:uncharacterized protein LOC131037537 n=1 Tax=Cryptomeria japonica TaxID=3369 RepID=UPI0025ABE7F7|nr:uncharacterized protein LOC131037537 [Cryptomeria japonica]
MKVYQNPEGPVCNRCKQERGINRLSAINNMDPGPQPPELACLTQVEEILIARLNPILQVTHATGGQFKYKGHTISFPQHIEKIAEKLPHSITSLPIIIVRRKYQRGTSYNFIVNRDHVYRALQYKIQNDKFYADVTIDTCALENLSEGCDQNIFEQRKTVNMELDSDTNEIWFVGQLLETKEENIIDHTTSMASKPPNAQREMELIRAWINNNNTHPSSLIEWPSIGGSPINEYTTLGLLDMVFPTLSPNGKCDWLEPRIKQVHLHEYAKHLIQYRDNHFGKHPKFQYYITNMIMRHRAQTSTFVFIKRNLGELPITIMELRKHMENIPNSHLADRLMQFGTTLRGTRSYWTKCRAELTDMLHQIGTPTIFFTLSAIDLYWPDLHALMPSITPSNPREAQLWRKKNVIDYPHIVAQYMHLRNSNFRKHVLEKGLDVRDYWYRYEWQHRGSPHVHGFL